jgi:Rrf2 family protein
MQIPAKAEYALRALLTLAASEEAVSAEHLAQLQDLPAKYLGAILSDLRRSGLVTSQRGKIPLN